MRTHSLLAFLLLVVCGQSSMALAASFGSLNDEIERTAEVVKSALKDASDIKVMEFTDLSQNKHSGSVGPGLKASFADVLKKKGIVHNDNAAHILTGEYFVNDIESLKNGEPLQLEIKLGVKNRKGQKLVEILPIDAAADAAHFGKVTATNDIAKAFGVHGTIRSDRDAEQKGDNVPTKEERKADMGQRVLNPQGFVSGTRIRSDAQSPYEVEILAQPVSAKGQPAARKPRLQDGLPFVDLAQNDLYEVRIHNNSKLEVAVTLSVDGLDAFYFADAQHRKDDGTPSFTNFIIKPNDNLTIPGWFQKLKPPDNYLSFLVAEHGKGAISKAGISSRVQVGVIHLQFSNCRSLEGSKSGGRTGKETGFGPPKSVEQKSVRYETDPPHCFISIRYDHPQK